MKEMDFDLEQVLFDKNEDNLDRVARMAVSHNDILRTVLNGLEVKKEVYRSNCFKVLNRISESDPGRLYPEWDLFAGYIRTGKVFQKYIAAYVIANLIPVDKEKRFDDLFEAYFGLLADESVIPASHAALNAGKIVKTRPELESRITGKLLKIDEIDYVHDHCDLIKSYVIQAFDEYFEQSGRQAEILEFIKTAVESHSPKTKKLAKEFLKKWNK